MNREHGAIGGPGGTHIGMGYGDVPRSGVTLCKGARGCLWLKVE